MFFFSDLYTIRMRQIITESHFWLEMCEGCVLNEVNRRSIVVFPAYFNISQINSIMIFQFSEKRAVYNKRSWSWKNEVNDHLRISHLPECLYPGTRYSSAANFRSSPEFSSRSSARDCRLPSLCTWLSILRNSRRLFPPALAVRWPRLSGP